MSDNFPTDAAYGDMFGPVITDRLKEVGYLVIDTHNDRKLGYDIMVIPPGSKRRIKIELKRQRGLKHLFELYYRNTPSDWRGKADQMWVWSDGNNSFEIYDAKKLEAHLLKLEAQGLSFKCGDFNLSVCVELPFNCVEAGYRRSFSLQDITL